MPGRYLRTSDGSHLCRVPSSVPQTHPLTCFYFVLNLSPIECCIDLNWTWKEVAGMVLQFLSWRYVAIAASVAYIAYVYVRRHMKRKQILQLGGEAPRITTRFIFGRSTSEYAIPSRLIVWKGLISPSIQPSPFSGTKHGSFGLGSLIILALQQKGLPRTPPNYIFCKTFESSSQPIRRTPRQSSLPSSRTSAKVNTTEVVLGCCLRLTGLR